MKEVWYFLYRDFTLDDKIFSSTYFDTFEDAWESREIMDANCNINGERPISPIMKGYVNDE